MAIFAHHYFSTQLIKLFQDYSELSSRFVGAGWSLTLQEQDWKTLVIRKKNGMEVSVWPLSRFLQ